MRVSASAEPCLLEGAICDPVSPKCDLKILNWFLIEKIEFDCHVCTVPDATRREFFGRIFQEDIRERTSWIAEVQDRAT
jgi:hypothetical protein